MPRNKRTRRPPRRTSVSPANVSPLQFPSSGALSHPSVQFVFRGLARFSLLLGHSPAPTEKDALVVLHLLRSGRPYLHLFYAVAGITTGGRQLDWAQLAREFDAYRALGRNQLRIFEDARWVDISDGESAIEFVADFKKRVNAAPQSSDPQVEDLLRELRAALNAIDTPSMAALKRVGDIEEFLLRHFAPPFLPEPSDPYLGENRSTEEPSLVGWKEIGAWVTRRTGGVRKSDRTLRDEFRIRSIELRHDGRNRHAVRVAIADLERGYPVEEGKTS
jgi:hypothetical protein